jgi:solute carrier family 13 (sodium-dependent dicarboxylate transporter), member 2/3/5
MTEALDYAVSAVVIAELMAFLLGLSRNPANPKLLLGQRRPRSGVQGLCQYRAGAGGVGTPISPPPRPRPDSTSALRFPSSRGSPVNHVVVGAILVGFVMAFLVPSTTARVACLVPIALGIISAFGVNKRGAFAGMLMITTVQTASIWNVGIKTAAAQNMVAVGFIEKTLQKSITWLEWFIVAAPFGILMSIALYFVMTRMMPAEVTDIPGGREQIRKSLAELGPMKISKKRLLAISLTLLLLWAAEGVLRSFDTSSTTVAAVALMFLPGIGIMTWKEAQPRIPWGTVVLFGIGISVGTALLQTKGAS